MSLNGYDTIPWCGLYRYRLMWAITSINADAYCGWGVRSISFKLANNGNHCWKSKLSWNGKDVTRELGESGDVINNTLCKQSKNKSYHTNLQCHHIMNKRLHDFHMIYWSEMWQTWPRKCWNSQLLQSCLFWSYKFQLQVGLYTGALFIQQSLGWDLYLCIFILLIIVGILTITGICATST